MFFCCTTFSAVPESNGVGHGFGEKGLDSSTTDVGGTWDVNGESFSIDSGSTTIH